VSDQNSRAEVMAAKDGSKERPIPSVWRPVFREIVSAFVKGDYRLLAGVPCVEPVPIKVATQIENYIQDYGATLTQLPEEAWHSSVCIWTGSHWDALVDLWTEAEGRSDLVLAVRVSEAKPGFVFTIHMVYVP
jgi:hypothetical protein